MPNRLLRPCPCSKHRNTPVKYHIWYRHQRLLQTGRLERWDTDKEDDDAVSVEEPADLSEVTSMKPHERFSVEVVELVSRGVVSVTGAGALLKATTHTYDRHLPEDIRIPPSWHMAKKWGVGDHMPIHTKRHFCPTCDFLFPEESASEVCPSCKGKKTRYQDGKPARVAIYFSLADKITRMFQLPAMARALVAGTRRQPQSGSVSTRELHDVWDGTLMDNLLKEIDDADPGHLYLFLGQSNDGVEVEKGVTYTPITAKVLNLPPKMRGMSSLPVGSFLIVLLFSVWHTL